MQEEDQFEQRATPVNVPAWQGDSKCHPNGWCINDPCLGIVSAQM